MKKLRYSKWLGYSFPLLAILILGWVLFKPNPLKAAASNMSRSIAVGDIQSLYDSTIVEERQCCNLSRENLSKAWSLLLGQAIKSSKIIEMQAAQQTEDATQATAAILFQDSVGTPWQIHCIANQAEGGPKTSVMITLLLLAIGFDEDGKRVKNKTARTSLEGIQRYRPKLEAIGIHRIMLNPSRCVTWDELETIYRTSVKEESQ